MKRVIVFFAVFCLAAACQAEIIYVDAGATGANNGTSWADAYKYLQDALWTAEPNQGVQIWVAQGTYRPDVNTSYPSGSGDRTATFQLKNGLALYGGFPTGGGLWESRDPNLHQTILSGDINVPNNNGDNSNNVVTGSDTNSTAILDGFTVNKGNTGGMYNYSGSPTTTNCAFCDNSYGMFNYVSSSPTIINCAFCDNSASGMYNYDGSRPVITNCTFIGNSGGGGMINSYYSNSALTNCTFIGNSADHGGGGMYNDLSNPGVFNCTFTGNSAGNGGGMYNYTSDPSVVNCAFNYNTSRGNGGAISSGYWCFPGVGNCTFTGNSASSSGGGIWQELGALWVTDCIFSGNSATDGGGIYNYYYGTPTITNCTFSGNSASGSGGGMYTCKDEGEPDYSTITNCIFWGNTAPAGSQIYIYNAPSLVIVSFSDVQDGLAGTGNINEDPLFIDANGPDEIIGTEDDNLRLLSNSPCIDAGDNNAWPYLGTDLDGRDRLIDGDCNSTVIVDMGAFEFTYAYFGDFDSDCEVDFKDFAIQAGFWLTDEFPVDIAPTPAGDGIVDIYDLAVLCDNWLAGK